MPEQVTRSIIVGASAADVFELWSRLETFPTFMKYVRSVVRTGQDTTHWVVEGPLGKDVEWDAQLTKFEPPVRIAWTTAPEDEVRTSGQVTFTELSPAETQLTVMLQYVLTGGAAKLASLFAKAGERVEEELRRFKAFAEGRPQAEERAGV
jgi:uncharacterized membrane protein